jgi:hypothetical protein
MSELDAEGICNILGAYNIATHDEAAMQRDVATILDSVCAYVKEAVLSAKDRVDFLVGGVGVECKIDGAKNDVLRQLLRYSESDAIKSLVLVTTKAKHRSLDGLELSGKRLHVVWVSGI